MHDDPLLPSPSCPCGWHGEPAVDLGTVEPGDETLRAAGRSWSRRAVLQGALLGTGLGLAGLAGFGGLARAGSRSPAGASSVPTTVPAAPLEQATAGAVIDEAATVAAPAERLLPTTTVAPGPACPSPLPTPTASGAPRRVMFPMGPTPRCAILDNFGDPRGSGRRHEGIDILATLGQEVYAVADGELVDQADASASLSGNAWGLVAFEDGTYYFYAHLSGFAAGLRPGDCVRKGQLIGYVGDTGNPGPGNYHLHFEVRPGGKRASAVDPLPLLDVPASCTIT